MISKTHNTINLIYCQSQKFNSKRKESRGRWRKNFLKEGWQQCNLYLRRNVMNTLRHWTHFYLHIRIKINFCNIKRRASKKTSFWCKFFTISLLALCDAKRCLKIIKISHWKLDCFWNVSYNRCRRKIRDDYGTETKIIAQRHSLKYFFIASHLLSLWMCLKWNFFTQKSEKFSSCLSQARWDDELRWK